MSNHGQVKLVSLRPTAQLPWRWLQKAYCMPNRRASSAQTLGFKTSGHAVFMQLLRSPTLHTSFPLVQGTINGA